ncbi:aminotransferase class I/II-fold pyridoxal phosphate-dependent enzyme [Candidatus Saganbacteria bacterium]|nr:aminotransferase class I/II-fold pyridoxal phosphate-dependent enzyme [Candidatus Saganbacteria bacterium]
MRLERRLYEVHRNTAMQMLSAPRIPRGSRSVSVVHDVPVAEGVRHDNYWGLTFSDGMRAITSAVEFGLRPGDEVAVAKPLYGCTDNYFGVSGVARVNRGFVVHEIDLSNPQNILEILNPKTKVVYFETETNPNLRVYDLEAISRLAHGQNPNIVVVVDNTFPGPAGCNPLLHGADIVVHSGTKVLGGFLQEMAGVVVMPKTSWKDLFLFRKNTGGISSPDQVHHLLTRGLPSLYGRYATMQASAQVVAECLNSNDHVSETIYPGLPNYAFKDNARRLLTDWDGKFAPGYMICFIPEGRNADEREKKARAIVDHVAKNGQGIISHAVSLGGNQSLIEMPFLGTHATVSAEEKKKWGIDKGMVRLSIGLAEVSDQIEILERAIGKAYS